MKKLIIWYIIIFLVFVFAIVSFIYGPSPDPPTYLKSSDPYWYSGE